MQRGSNFFKQSYTPSFKKMKLYRLLTYNPDYSYDIFSTCIKGVFNYTENVELVKITHISEF